MRIAKEGNTFCYPEHIDREMRQLFAQLTKQKHLRSLNVTEFAAKAAHFLAELNAIHPFREGNGRTQLSFLIIVAERARHPLALQRLDPRAILNATIASFGGDERPLVDVIATLVR